MSQLHHYKVEVIWTGSNGSATTGPDSYKRDHEVSARGKQTILGSSDPAFRGDATRWNPEDLLVASLSACHKLWYLHLCAAQGITVLSYRDSAEGIMEMFPSGSGRFTQVTLHPIISIREGDKVEQAHELHEAAHEMCFIANSVNFPVHCNATVVANAVPSA